MSKCKLLFCLTLFIFSFLYVVEERQINILELVNKDTKKSKVVEILTNKDLKSPKTFLNIGKLKEDKPIEEVKIKKEVNENKKSDPLVYIYNTHQTEEYAKNIYNITPTVVTVSSMLQEAMEEKGIYSFVETNDVIKEVKKRGYDYPGTYTVSLENLQKREKQYPSLKYFFDVHRDSVTGSLSRISCNNKSNAKVMFLVGANYDNYKARLKKVKIMEEFLEKECSGIVRNTFINTSSGYNQKYTDNMFLVEVGGPDNTLEEIYNTSNLLAKAIYHMIKETS